MRPALPQGNLSYLMKPLEPLGKLLPTGFPDNGNQYPTTPVQVWQGDRVAWNMHLPTQTFQDDSGNSNASGPDDTTPGVLPATMSWFSRTDRPTNEMKEIASVSGNTIIFTSPLIIGYRTSHLAQLTRYTPTGKICSGTAST